MSLIMREIFIMNLGGLIIRIRTHYWTSRPFTRAATLATSCGSCRGTQWPRWQPLPTRRWPRRPRGILAAESCPTATLSARASSCVRSPRRRPSRTWGSSQRPNWATGATHPVKRQWADALPTNHQAHQPGTGKGVTAESLHRRPDATASRAYVLLDRKPWTAG